MMSTPPSRYPVVADPAADLPETGGAPAAPADTDPPADVARAA